ncbi:hypothetical protein BK128_21385 [Viridibacillus sp. FSL H7-0596]|uniref:hypothetical protein n=1 Tax=Viridibacillus sp. FSL H7-0596 TaxID=1928923 RepID=UPI00096F2634|nr:hypothetical protein [Viridibacillus sp. FSL H7-0596]OMC81826.1 hypothetical protein BK128_21385 [Viridibacillus sp. FSL H7-0596]
MSVMKTEQLKQTIKFAESELQFAPNDPVITITMKRDDFQEILSIADKEINKYDKSNVLV